MDTSKVLDNQVIIGKLLQRMDSVTLSLSEKKNELDTFVYKAQEAADTLDVASTKLISHFSDVATLEQTLQETLRSGIEAAAHHIATQASHDIQHTLSPMQEMLKDTMSSLQQHTNRSMKDIRKQKWIWMSLSGVFGAFVAGIVALMMILFYLPKTSGIDLKLQKYGHAFMEYYETLSPKEQDLLLKKLSTYMKQSQTLKLER